MKVCQHKKKGDATVFAQKGGIVWGKQAGATDADLAEAQRLYALAKGCRLADGSKPQSVLSLEAAENGDKVISLMVGSQGNGAGPTPPATRADSQNPSIGAPGTVYFNPWKVGAYGDGTFRIPEASLVHEIHHAWEYTQGISSPTRQGREVSATSIENWHRKAMGVPQRTAYGAWPVSTHLRSLHEIYCIHDECGYCAFSEFTYKV